MVYPVNKFFFKKSQNKGKCSLNSIAEGKTIRSRLMKRQEYILTNSAKTLKYKIALIYIFQRQHTTKYLYCFILLIGILVLEKYVTLLNNSVNISV